MSLGDRRGLGSTAGVLVLLSVAFGPEPSVAQTVPLWGTVVCPARAGETDYRPVRRILVWPITEPNAVNIADEVGVYHVALPYRSVADRDVTIAYRGSADTVEIKVHHVSRRETRGGRTVRLDTQEMQQACAALETGDYFTLAAIRDSLVQALALAEDGDAKASGAGGALHVLGGIARIIVAFGGAGAPSPPDSMHVDTLPPTGSHITPTKLEPGRFIERARASHSYNTGFAFTPSRNMDEAVFWNASALAFQPVAQLSLQTDYQRFLRFSGAGSPSDGWAVGAGALLFHENERRTVTFPEDTLTDTYSNTEWLFAAGVGWRMSSALAFGLTARLTHQRLQRLTGIKRVREFRADEVETFYEILRSSMVRSRADLDLSTTFEPEPGLTFGMTAIGILGSRVATETGTKGNRALGAGLSYALGRANLGIESVMSAECCKWAVGIDFVPFDHALGGLGFSSLDRTLTMVLAYRTFMYRYVRDERFGHHHSTGVRFFF